jgi:hypothetical protein
MSEAATTATTPAVDPAAAATTPAATTTPPPAAAPTDWTQGLADESRGYIQNKGWKDPGSLLDSYRNLEKLHGVPPEQIIKLPKDPNDKAAWDQISQKLGRPEKPDGYKIPMPEKGGDPEFAKWAQQQLFENGIPAKAGETLVAKFNEYVASQAKAREDAAAVERTNANTQLQKEWGSAYNHEVEVAKRACATFGVDPATVDKIESAIGFDGVIKLFNKIGKGLGEASFIDGQRSANSNAPMTPEAAQSKLNENMSNKEWAAKYMSGDKAVQAEASRLLGFINPNQG